MREPQGGVDLARLLGQAADEGMAIGTGRGAVVKVLDNDGLLTGVPPGQEDDHLVGLHVQSVGRCQVPSLQMQAGSRLWRLQSTAAAEALGIKIQ